MSEDQLLRRLRARLGPSSLIGDDAAILSLSGEIAVTVDSQISGVHFIPSLDAAHVARRLLAVNLSDLAAMGGVGAEPSHAFLALSAPPDFDHDRFFRAFTEACSLWNVTLAGGDLARCDQVVATLTLIGTKPDGGRWLRRSDAKPGHDLWLGGTVGESAAGRILIARGADERHRAVRRHLLPVPQLELGRWLGQQAEGASMDVSDGVAIDLHRLCRESGVGAVIDADVLPLPGGFFDLCKTLSVDPYELALSGGEDYVLLFTLPPGMQPPGCHKIGRILREKKIDWIREGRRRRLPASGWDHLKT
ncbi:MAG TPA: thiamine-phosphate kinase [Thermoanaerobaculia bacterium]|nr:thiamine-phosphate kinase [Thermoanaerobaculia bacterium]